MRGENSLKNDCNSLGKPCAQRVFLYWGKQQGVHPTLLYLCLWHYLFQPYISARESRCCADQFEVHTELQGKEVHGTNDTHKALACSWCYETACLQVPVAGKTTRLYNQNFQILTEMVTYPRWQMVWETSGWKVYEAGFSTVGSYTGHVIKIFCMWYKQFEPLVDYCWLNATTRTEKSSLKITGDQFTAGINKSFSYATGREFLEGFATTGLWTQLISESVKRGWTSSWFTSRSWREQTWI